MATDLSVVIVSWNVWDLLQACLLSLQAASRPLPEPRLRAFGPVGPDVPTLEVLVVDNASSDGTGSLLAARFPWVTLLANSENLGFPRACNQGCACSSGRFIFFLNPDTWLDGESLWTLYRTIQSRPEIGLVGPALRYGDGTPQESRRRFPTFATGFWESTWLAQLWPRNPWRRRYQLADWPATFQQEVDWLVGAALLVRREALVGVGLFDEGFFMYSEELDLCRRMVQAGWRIAFVPAATVVHYEGRSSEQVATARHIHFNTSKVRYYGRAFGPVAAEWLRRYLLWEYRLQILLEGAKALLQHRRALRLARIEAYRAVLASGLR